MSDPLRDLGKSGVSQDPGYIFWAKEVDLARKREQKWRKNAEIIINLYEGEKETDNNFNILYANTELLLPKLYNQLPKADVERRYKDDDPLGKCAADALERVINYTLDQADAAYDSCNSLFEMAVLGALVPGRGLTRFKYDPTIKGTPPSVGDDEEQGERGEGEEALEAEKPKQLLPAEGERVEYESICGEDVDFDAFLMGYARRWVDVPWVGYEHWMEKPDLEANFGRAIAAKIPLLEPVKRKVGTNWKEGDTGVDDKDNNRGSQKGAYVIEIWNKRKKEIVFFCPVYTGGLLGKPKEDPYGLTGFFNCPQPLQLVFKRSGLVPQALYKMYEPQAKELNRISRRINRIIEALKVRGFYDNSLKGLQELLTKDDNTLLPVENVAALMDGKTLENSVQFMPLEKLITVLQQLYMAREQCKNTIYEITGLADIMRGDTQASETLGAQRMKAQFGEERIARFKRAVSEYIRDCCRIMGELAAKNFDDKTFAQMTGLPYAMPEEVAKAKRALAAIQQQAMMFQRQMQMQPPQMPGQPPPGPPPQMQQLMGMAQQAQAVLSKPAWADVTKLLKTDLQRYYRIDIETNSTVAANTAQDRQDIQDAMTALSNTVESLGPLVEQRVMPMPVFKTMLLLLARRYTFGRELEESIKQIPDQVPNTVNNTPDAAGGAAGKSPQEQQAILAKSQLDLQTTQAKSQLLEKSTAAEMAQHDHNMQKIAFQKERDAAEHALDMKEIATKMMLLDHEVNAKKALTAVDINAKKSIAATDIETKRQVAATDIDVKRQTAATDIDTKQKTAAADVEAKQKKAAIPKSNGKAGPSAGGRKFKLVRGGDGKVSEIHEA